MGKFPTDPPYEDQPAGIADLERAYSPQGVQIHLGGPNPVVTVTCRLCGGHGRREAFVCSACGGAGIVLVK